VFEPLPDKPDHQAIELAILDFWRDERIFERLRAQNADGPRFSFIDGPVTANKTLAVHTAWGRTLKDVFQRYQALRGHHLRYQNGFDCQGLWIEVGVERQLGLNSKRDIEAYGLAEFAAKCRDVVVWSSTALTEGSIRLGMWMDWERSYYTFSDSNIEYIWRFLAVVHERGWLYQGNRPTEWCPRCGTSISAHEMAGSYVDRDDPSLTVRLPLVDRPGEHVVIWTTTPWTLPANVAVAVHPDARYGRRDGDWMAVDRAGDGPFDEVLPGSALVGWRYRGPFDDIGPGGAVAHRVVAWDEVALDEGTGMVHIAPGCGAEDFALGRVEGLEVLSPVDESGRYVEGYGWLTGLRTDEARQPIIDDLERRGLLVAAGTIHHRFPECWRCHTPLIFRLSDDWFIAVDPLRDQLRAANAEVTWVPAYMGKRMDDWLVNMTDWNISRRRYYGMPLPFYPCGCGRLTVVSSRAELEHLAVDPVGDLPELRRPWIDAVRIACPGCGQPVARILEVGDVWLDAGIVPFSTLGWQNPTPVPGGLGTGAAAGLTVADLPDHATWEQWFPADLVSEMREQIRLWFYSQLFMSVALTGRAPYRRVLGYEKMLDEHGREMHGSHGNMIEVDEAFARMGADVMRWQFCMQPPSQNLLFGFTPADEIKRRLLTVWNSVSFLVQYANLVDFVPELADLDGGPDGALAPLDTWLVHRVRRLVADVTAAYEATMTVDVLRAFDAAVEDLSNWYIRRSRRRFWDGDRQAMRTLWYALVTAVRLVAPIVPFLAEHLWQRLVAARCADAAPSVFLAGWPAPADVDDRLLDEWSVVRTVVELGRQARASAGLRGRQPLRRMVAQGAADAAAHVDVIADELRVKEVVFDDIEAVDVKVRPNLPVLGPRLGPALPAVRTALAEGRFTMLDGDAVEVDGQRLEAAEVLVERVPRAGWAFASTDGGVAVALDTSIDDELRTEARVNDLVHAVNRLRKERGLELTDRIVLTVPAPDADLLARRDWIAAETLATEVVVGDGPDLDLRRA
jgi:isoleucyl-tRNA synthetase